MQILHVLLGMRYRSSSMLKALMQRPNSVLQLPQVALYHIPKALSIGKTKKFRVHRTDLIEKVSDSPASTDNSTEAGHITADSGYYITSR